MSKNLKNCMQKLKFIATIKDPAVRRKTLNSLSDECLYKALNEIAVNVVARKVPLTLKQKRELRKHRIKIQKLACKTNNKKKQKQLVNQSGGILPIILPAVISAIASIIGSKI